MENVDISLLQPSGSVCPSYDRLFTVDVKAMDSEKVLMSLTVEGCRLYDLILSVCSNRFMVSVKPYIDRNSLWK